MEEYARALLYGVPFFLLLILIELITGKIKTGSFKFFDSFDAIASLSSGMTHIVRDVLGIGVLSVIAYPFLLAHLNVVYLPNTWYMYLIAFICLDFAGYWTHRIAHHVNYFWNSHVIHHSSERYILSCALRQPFTPEITLYSLFLIPASILGVPAEVVATIAPLHLFAQFWYHTEFIGHLGFLEKIIVTPQQHAVHHSVNKEYMDKNFSPVFCVWDRWFGTFQELLPSVKPVFGITRPARTWNPFKIGVYHLWLMIKDAWRTKDWKAKLTIWFKPTGWRPQDVEEKYPVQSIKDIYHYEKYDTKPSFGFIIWAWFQLFFVSILIFYWFYDFATINTLSNKVLLFNKNNEAIGSNTLWYAVFVLLSIFAYTSVMDREKIGSLLSLCSNALGLYLLFGINGGVWFHLEVSSIILVILFSFSAIGALLFGLSKK